MALPARVSNQPVTDKSLQFVQNKNQWPAAVRFAANLPNGRLFLKENGLVYNFVDGSQIPQHHGEQVAIKSSAVPGKAKGHAYQVNFLHAAKSNLQTIGADERPGIRNYYLGKDPKKWASGVKSYGEVTYQSLYPGVNMHLYQKGSHLKYEFLLQPRANPDQIQLQYDGAEVVLLNTGDLQIKTTVTTILERKPIAFQTINGQQREVACRFKLINKVLSFEFPEGYNQDVPLLIDPELIFSSYSGSTADNWGFTATYDNAGNMYSGGITNEVGFPTKMGAYDSTWNGNLDGSDAPDGGWDMAILKFDPAANGEASLVYATYLGGSRADIPSSLVVNTKNELMILGTTSSLDYPITSGVVGPSYKGGGQISPLGEGRGITYSQGSDLVISRLSADGTALLASTFMGGSQNDGLLERTSELTRNYGDQFRSDIITDTADNVYVVSSTASTDFPVKNAFQTSTGGQTDAVIFKIDANLSNVAWSSYLGGSGADAAYSIQLEPTTNTIFICGGTNSSTLPGVSGAYRPVFLGGSADGFVAKISNDGQQLQRVSYLGTNDFDLAYFVQLDGAGDVYLLGQTLGNYPVTRGVYTARSGRQFIQKLNNNLTASIFSTVFGSNDNPVVPNISPTAFLVDDCNRIYVCGWGGGANAPYGNGTTDGLPVTANAYQRTTDGQDFYLMLLSRDAATLEYATFMGGAQGANLSGEHVDGGTSRFDKRGFVYQAVCGGCGANSLFPTTPNVWSNTNQSTTNCNNAAFKFDFNIVQARAGDSESVCANSAPIQLTGFSPAGGVWSGPGVTSEGVFTPSKELIGVQTINYTVANGSCVSTGTKTITVVAVPEATFSNLPPKICLPNSPVTLIPTPAGGTFTGPGITGDVFDPAVAGIGTHTITYTIGNATGCASISTQQVVVGETPVVVAGPDARICSGSSPIQLTGFSPAGGTWSGTGVSSTGLFTPTESMSGTYVLTYTVTANNCTASATKTIIIDPTSAFTQGPDQLVCADSAPFMITDAMPLGGTWSGNGVSPAGLFTPGPQVIGTNVLTYTVTVGACSGISTKTITVVPAPEIKAGAEPTECGTATAIQGYAPFTAKFTNTTTGATGYLWNFGDGTTSTEVSPSHVYTNDGNYQVTLTVYFGDGCQTTREVVSVLTDKNQLIPNIFTPNGDGKNDTFAPRVTCLPTDLKVFNRWGQVVYNQKNYQNTWDGNSLPEGIYYYHLTNSKGNNWKGWVEIVR
ncbi:DUF7948 domain-containing protein [Adhaeribacter radiodurans]|uniref:Gliding motility-associated C-terminal domain-containing protein n=1 Tax=Adhaeribacter radiodurans TaxID=2745197 RepID=A0A7L7LDS8_9BACT|nr:gliding motility-associated C-terminal domain-containing protein [Adhaeribacter radiodurans]QMU30988.1 gliding motility-associated C-terminal domain-containing protein [Adhaeribacter radiodurans]